MTRRIAVAILLTVWALLIAGGVVGYGMTRSVLLENLDTALINRAASLMQQGTGSQAHEENSAPTGDRFLIQNEMGQTVARVTHSNLPAPELLHAGFSETAEGQPLRTIKVRLNLVDGSQRIVTYSTSAEPLLHLLHRLQWALLLFSLFAGPATALVALVVSRIALRPLQSTAREIGAIDQQNLQRRIEVQNLPTELQPVGQRLNEMLARLEEGFAQRTSFLAAASHELRTPVAALVTCIEVTLRKPRTTDEYRQTLESCRQDGRALRLLVERLMEQVRGERTEHEQNPSLTNITQLIGHCMAAVAAVAETKQITLLLLTNQDVQFLTQPIRLQSILTNLLSNAIDYNRPGGRVEIGCEIGPGSTLQITVRDTGVGIESKHLPRLFEPFYRAAAPAQDHLGLGLSLVQTHVQAMGGTVGVESMIDAGTVFFVTLPAPTLPSHPKSDSDLMATRA